VGQVVDLGPERPDDPLPPRDARYLSERNMRTDRETVRKARPGGDDVKKRIDPDRGEEDFSGKTSVRDGTESSIKNKTESAYTRKDLLLSMADIDGVLKGDHGSFDYLPEVARGDITSLNARRYAYAAFYNRLKKVIVFYWEPWSAVERIGWTGRTLETRLRMVVDADGTLESVEVVSSCGYPVIDAAAVRALRKSAPIYNIPKALLNEEDKFDEVWAFYITAN
jgi:TonB family protein